MVHTRWRKRVLVVLIAQCRHPNPRRARWYFHRRPPLFLNMEFTKPRRRRQRRRHGTKGLMSRTIAVHVRYNSWYISLPSSARRRHEMTKFCVV